MKSCNVCGYIGDNHYDSCPCITSKHFLILEEDVAKFDFSPEEANELLRQMWKPNGVKCDAAWMRSAIENIQDSDIDF